MRAEDFLEHSKWIDGPEFLYDSENKWPKLGVKYDSLPVADAEIKKDVTVNAVVEEAKNPTSFFISYFSSWMKLKTSVAWVLKLKELLLQLSQKRKEFSDMMHESAEDANIKEQKVLQKMQQFKTMLKIQCLTSEDLTAAEHFIILFEQHHRFEPEISALRANKTVSKDSQLYRLDPVIDDGVLRVGGRLKRAAMPFEIKHPVILCKNMHVATLILRYIHHLLGHAGRSHMLSRLRRKYWIISANSAARKILSDCVTCRRNRGKLLEQKMADLPQERKQDLYLKRRWKQVQYMAELFWKRWITEYLPLLHERQKWMRQKRNISPGDIVLIADATAPRGCWQMGRVLAVKADGGGLVRSVQLQTKTSVLERPVTKLCLLLEASAD
ncbi:uncharacterized protein LOC116718567 isoform X10 [Xiphophorus hellerii]|uniref:uncharacterized protein LOC116718567 isoform X10 n=1 Tax=Xiphophorus hellerii TaxID=8084 RepID=UPI0013B3CEEF|nr:uncharacterized protein LOC116718567 isoform X10 [Xiphophorus hellerii]